METSSQVVVVGRLGAQVRTKELPSGDVVTSFTVIVDRPVRERTKSQKAATVDAISCITMRARTRTMLERMEPGTLVSVDGTLRRRFWRGGPGGSTGGAMGGAMGSAMEVVARSIQKV